MNGRLYRLYNRTLNNCMYYEEERKTLELINEIGVLRGIAYCLQAHGDPIDDFDNFAHFMNVQTELLGNGGDND